MDPDPNPNPNLGQVDPNPNPNHGQVDPDPNPNHGQVDHLSLPNTSGKSRHTFQLHMVEFVTLTLRLRPQRKP